MAHTLHSSQLTRAAYLMVMIVSAISMQNLVVPFILLALGMGSALTMTACRRLRIMGSRVHTR